MALVGITSDTRVPPSHLTGVIYKFPGPVVADVTVFEGPRCYCGVTHALRKQ
jgi:hypothetical protein